MRFNPLKPTVTSAQPLVAQRKAPQPPGATNFTVTLSENHQKDGLELRFPARPNDDVLSDLKLHGWRWSRYNTCWYHRNTPEHRQYAERFLVGAVSPTPVVAPKPEIVSPIAPIVPPIEPTVASNVVPVQFSDPEVHFAVTPSNGSTPPGAAPAWKRAFLRR